MDDRPACAEAVEIGKNQNLAGLYRRYGDALHQFLLGLLRDRADAEDALQQVFLKLLEGWETIEPDKAKGWLFTVAYHEAMAVRRRRNLDEAARAKMRALPVWETEFP